MRAEIYEQKLELAVMRMDTDDEEEHHNDANKTMSLTRMKEKKISTVKRDMALKDKRILDYIKYLIGQQGNNEF